MTNQAEPARLKAERIVREQDIAAMFDRRDATITRLQAELAEARDKALDEAARLMDLKDAGWRALETKHRAAGNKGPYLGGPSYSDAAQAIRALKSTKPPIL